MSFNQKCLGVCLSSLKDTMNVIYENQLSGLLLIIKYSSISVCLSL